jgi:hypothetical protein
MIQVPFGYWIVLGPSHGDPYEVANVAFGLLSGIGQRKEHLVPIMS